MTITEYFFLLAAIIAGILPTVGYAVLSSVPADFRIARRCFWGTALLLGLIAVVWGTTTTEVPWKRIPAVGIVAAMVAIGLTETLRWVAKKDAGAPLTHAVAGPVLASQIAEMREIESFLTTSQDNPPTFGDTEENIRRVFGLNALLSFNLKYLRRQFNSSLVSKSESEAIDAYFTDSVFLMDLDYVHTGIDPVTKAIILVFCQAGIGGIKLSKTYINATNKLKKYSISVQLPKDLREKLILLDKTLSDDMNILVDVINEQIAKNPQMVVQDQDNKSRYLAVTTNLYWHKFIPLKPRVDEIISSIRTYLDIAG